MQDFINWIVDNWQFVSSVAISILGFILLFLKKRFKVVDSATEILMFNVPAAIRYAEKGVNCSVSKKEAALTYLRNKLLNLFPASNWKDYEAFCDALIENVLNTPQKKQKGDK